MDKCTNILRLTDDCLINIFKHCDIQTLGRAASSCKKLNNIIKNYNEIWYSKSRMVLGSNMLSPTVVERSQPFLTPLQRCKVSRNWVSGDHQEDSVVRYTACLPWIGLEQDFLYVSKGSRIMKFSRDENGHVTPGRISAPSRHQDDLCKFVLNGEEIVSAGWAGRLCRYSKSNLYCHRSQRIHNKGIKAVDAKRDIIITGSIDETIKIWKTNGPNRIVQTSEIHTEVRVLCVSLLPSMRFFLAGLPGTKGIHPLPIYDIERAQIFVHLGIDFITGAGVTDIYPETDNSVLTCGYDSDVKLWDIRTPQRCVSQWEEPFNNYLYCVKSDNNITVIGGANRSGYFHIWDKRAATVVQTYHNREFESPVYSLAFDASHVYSALNRAVVEHCFDV